MTAAEIVAALDAEGIDFHVTERGTVVCEPIPSVGLLTELREGKVDLVKLLRDPDRHGWEYPSDEAMAAARRLVSV